MGIGALPSLATGDYPRGRTQQWARAIYEDQPVAGRAARGGLLRRRPHQRACRVVVEYRQRSRGPG